MPGTFDYLIIGGGIAGTTCAETIRAKDSQAKIAILESGEYPLYSKVLIPSYLKGRIEREKLFLRTVSHYNGLQIDFFANTDVSSVNSLRKEVLTKANNLFSYKKLLIASGGRPASLTGPLSAATTVEPLRMHTVEDADRIKNIIETAEEKKIMVIGESFIALEFLEIFSIAGFEVHAFAKTSYWGEERFGENGSKILEENFARGRIVVHKNAELSLIRNDEFYFLNGEHYKTPYLALGIGLNRDFSFIADLTVNKGIVTDEYLRSSNPDIYAAGDVAEYYDTRSSTRKINGNWTGSFLQGRTVALNMLGGNNAFNTISTYNIINMGTNITCVGDYHGTADQIFELPGKDSLVRVLTNGGKAIGGVLINRFGDKLKLSRLIEDGTGLNDLEKLFS